LTLFTDVLYTAIALVASVYSLSVYGWMRRRVRVANASGARNGRLVLAKASAATALRALWISLIGLFVGVMVTVRDALAAMEGTLPPFSLSSLILRTLFITMMLLVMDTQRIRKRTYVVSDRGVR